MCMCVYVCVYMCVCVYVCVYVCMCMYVCSYMCVCVCVCVCVYVYVCVSVRSRGPFSARCSSSPRKRSAFSLAPRPFSVSPPTGRRCSAPWSAFCCSSAWVGFRARAGASRRIASSRFTATARPLTPPTLTPPRRARANRASRLGPLRRRGGRCPRSFRVPETRLGRVGRQLSRPFDVLAAPLSHRRFTTASAVRLASATRRGSGRSARAANGASATGGAVPARAPALFPTSGTWMSPTGTSKCWTPRRSAGLRSRRATVARTGVTGSGSSALIARRCATQSPRSSARPHACPALTAARHRARPKRRLPHQLPRRPRAGQTSVTSSRPTHRGPRARARVAAVRARFLAQRRSALHTPLTARATGVAPGSPLRSEPRAAAVRAAASATATFLAPTATSSTPTTMPP